MICERCKGRGYETVYVSGAPTSADGVEVAHICPACNGQCVLHCCEGDRAWEERTAEIGGEG